MTNIAGNFYEDISIFLCELVFGNGHCKDIVYGNFHFHRKNANYIFNFGSIFRKYIISGHKF